jgi:hypothetical protein
VLALRRVVMGIDFSSSSGLQAAARQEAAEPAGAPSQAGVPRPYPSASHGLQDVPVKSTSLVSTVPAVRPGAAW